MANGAVVKVIVSMMVLTLLAQSITGLGGGGGGGTGTGSRQFTYPDLTISNISWSMPMPQDGLVIEVFATVSNDGASTYSPFTVMLAVDETEIATRVVGLMPSGNTTTVSGSWTAMAGSHIVRAVADNRGEMKESNEANNRMLMPLDVGHPDLVLEGLSYAPVVFKDGDQVTVTAVVRNSGASTVRAFKTAIYVDGNVAGSIVTWGLASGDSVADTATFIASSGPHLVEAVADSERALSEVTRSNNRRTIEARVGMPDLVVEVVALTPPASTIADGDDAIARATVRNLGADVHRPFGLGFSVNGVPQPDATIYGLTHNATENITFHWTVGPGVQTLLLLVDSGGIVDEADETHNTYITSVSPGYPDLSVKGISYEPLYPKEGDRVTLTVRVANEGRTTARSFGTSVIVNGLAVATAPTLGLPAGQGTTMDLNFTMPAGKAIVGVSVDMENLVAEDDETDNWASVTMEAPVPDLVVEGLTADVNVSDGEMMTIGARVLNGGDGNTTKAFTMRFYIDGTLVCTSTRTGMTTVIPWNVSCVVDAMAGDHQAYAVVDEERSVLEANETNNAMTVSYHIGVPDIVLQELTWTPDDPIPGQVVSIRGTLANIGAKSYRDMDVSFSIDDRAFSPARMNMLGLSVPATVTLMWTVETGEHVFRMKVDDTDEIHELNETDNVLTVSFPSGTVLQEGERPDLVAKRLDVMSTTPTDGNTISLVATIGMTGMDIGIDGRYADVMFFFGGQDIGTVQAHILGDEATAMMTWMASPGKGPIWVVVDPGHKIPETNESNNAVSAYVDIKASDLAVTGLRFISEGFDDGNTVTIFANIENNGPGNTTRPFLVTYFIDGKVLGSQAMDGFRTTGTMTVSMEWTAEPGNHDIGVAVDIDGQLNEVSKGDNLATDNATVHTPDLVIRDFEVPAASRYGTRNSVSCVIENAGDGSTVRTFDVDLLVDGAVQDVQRVTGLSSHSKVLVLFTAVPGPGDHIVSLALDAAGAVKEANETNNIASRDALKVVAPDLNVTYVWTPDENNGSQGRSLLFAQVANDGGDMVRRTEVGFFVDGVAIGDAPIEALPAGRTTVVSMEWHPGQTGHRIWVKADHYGSIPEADEGDNLVEITTAQVGLPDLVVSDLYIAGEFVDGSELTFFGMVRNMGKGEATDFTVGLYIDGQMVTTTEVIGLPGQTLSNDGPKTGALTFAFRWIGAPGPHTARLVADDRDTVEEVDDVTNDQKTTFSVGSSDVLVVETISYLPRTGGEDGSDLIVYAKVTNNGADLIRSFTIRFSDGGTTVNDARVEAIPGMNSVVVRGSIPVGTSTVYVSVDPEGEINEFDETNNEFTDYLEPQQPEGDGSMDLSISELFWVPRDPFDGEMVTFFAVLDNVGGSPILEPFNVTLHDRGSEMARVQVLGIPWGAYSIVAASWMIRGGTGTISAMVDVGNAVNENNEGNNGIDAKLEVAKPDLNMVNVTYSRGLAGQSATILVMFNNSGPGRSSAAFRTNIWLEGQSLASVISTGLMTESETWLEFEVPTSLTWGRKELLVEGDADDMVSEESEANDRLEEVSTPYPDIEVADLWWYNDNSSKDLLVLAEVTNTADDGLAGPFMTTVFVNGETGAEIESNDLPAHASRIIGWPIDKGSLGPDFILSDIRVMGDSRDQVMESRENNNVRHRLANGTDVYMPGFEDLSIMNIAVGQKAVQRTGESTFDVSTTVLSAGVNASGVMVRLLADGHTVGKEVLPDIVDGANVTVTIPWAGDQGTHVFKVILDSDRTNAEWDETENDLRVTVLGNRAPLAIPGKNVTVKVGEVARLEGRGVDMDGSIVLYEWDYEGDGTWDWSSNSTGNAEHRYSSIGTFRARFRVTDDKGANAEAEISVKVIRKVEFRPITEDETRLALAAISMVALIAIVVYFVKGEEMYREHKMRKDAEKAEAEGKEPKKEDGENVEVDEGSKGGKAKGPTKSEVAGSEAGGGPVKPPKDDVDEQILAEEKGKKGSFGGLFGRKK